MDCVFRRLRVSKFTEGNDSLDSVLMLFTVKVGLVTYNKKTCVVDNDD